MIIDVHKTITGNLSCFVKKKKPDMKATWSTFNFKKVMFHTPDVAYMHLQDLKKVICLFIGHIKTHVHSL